MRKTPTKNKHTGATVADIRTDVVNRLVEAIQSGAGEWKMPWEKLATNGMPHNPISRITYRGGNVISLWITSLERGYASNEWATFKQWQSVGGMVRKGQNKDNGLGATYCLVWKPSVRANPDDADSKAISGFYGTFTVFNREQIDFPEGNEWVAEHDAAKLALPEVERIEHADAFFAAVPADIRYGGDKAFYRPSGDYVQLPEWNQFVSPLHGYATLSHELAHWTGHKDRLAREFGKRFGDNEYAAEELTAELSSAFTCAAVGIDTVERTDHAAYLAGWCSMLKSDPSILWTVASRAQSATDYLTAFSTAKEVAA